MDITDHTPATITLGSDYVPEPPESWPIDRKRRFRAIVESHPAGWWTAASEPLLREYVLALEMAEVIQTRLDNIPTNAWDAKDLDDLLRARDRESKRAVQLARAMRLAQQTVAPTAAAKALERGAMASAPWN